MRAVGVWANIRLALFLAIFLVVHFVVHVLDRTLILGLRKLSGFCTRATGFPPKWLFDSATRPERRSTRDSVVDIHVESPANAHSWFGWPIVVPRSSADENPLGHPAEVAGHLVHGRNAAVGLSAPIYTNHLSTIVANFKPVPTIVYRREIAHSFDGCDLAVDWAYPEDNTHLFAGPVVSSVEAIAGMARALGVIDETFTRFGIPPQHGLGDAKYAKDNHIGVLSIIPGLLSESWTTYIRSFVRVAMSHGFAVAMVHTRGIGTPLTTPRIFHGGFTQDVRHWTYNYLSREALAKRFGRPTNAVLVGFSLGANVLGNFLAEDGDRVKELSAVVTAAAVSAPWRFHDVAVPMARWIQKMTYDADFKGGLLDYLKFNEKALRDPVTGKGVGFDYERALRIKDVPEFDEHVMVKHHGYRDADHYYSEVSCFQRLHQVTMPLVCVGVADDPICGPPPVSDHWAELCAKTPYLAYAELPSGGHLGCLGHPMAELTLQPTPIEALVCRSMAHFLVNLSHGTTINTPLHSDRQ